MANPIKTLARLFKRKPTNTLVSELYSRGIGRPLLAQSDLGAQVLKGYLAANTSLTTFEDRDSDSDQSVFEGVGIIDVSGALVSRPMGLCSPLSYAEIQASLNELMSDDSVKSIVIRLDSPGGEVSGCFDLADAIYSARGTKPIIASVDDMAYSAAYAIASACDEICMSRTSGVGSVGVVSYHVDQSQLLKDQGIKVEYLHAGQKKVNGNPTEPLADDARSDMQAEIDRVYGLFTSTVARNRGMDTQTIVDTQAGCYYGDLAISAGLADKILPFTGLIASLVSGSYSEKTPTALITKQPTAQATDQPVVIESLAESLPQDTTATNIENTTQDEELSRADEISTLCMAAGLPEMADEVTASKASVEDVRKALMDAVSAGEAEILTARSSPQQPANAAAIDTFKIYEARRQGA